MLLTRFTRPLSPHLTCTPATRSFLLTRHCAVPFLPFLVASLTRVVSQAREALLILDYCHDLYVFEYSCSRFSPRVCPSKFSVIRKPSTIVLSLNDKSRVNSSVPLRRQSSCSLGKSARLCSTRVVPRSRRPRLDCLIGLYSTQKIPET